ncbi:MAG TPA: hypothetical protein VGF73_08965 [Chthoniobacterales bacterium]|jgi:hypothetical protein
MNTTIGKIIALELGILIAILAWMQFAKPAERQRESHLALRAPEDQTFANVSPIYHPMAPQRPAVDYRANDDLDAAQPTVAYQQESVADPSADYGYATYPATTDPSNYIGDYPEPGLTDPDCYYDPYGYGYGQPAQIIVLNSSPRSFGARSRLTNPRAGGGRMMMMPRRPRQMRQMPRVNRAGARENFAPHRMAGARSAQSGRTIGSRRGR